MMDKSFVDNIIYAVDLGGSHLTVMAGVVDSQGQIDILGVEREECRGLSRKGILDNPSEVASCLVRLCKQLRNRIGLTSDIRNIFVSIGGKGLRFTTSEVVRDLQPTNRVSEAVLDEMEKECVEKFEQAYPDLSVAEVVWSNFVLDKKNEFADPLGQKAKHISGTYEVYYGLRAMKYKWQEAMQKQSQLKVAMYYAKPEALRTALLTKDDEQEGCAIIDFGSDTTTFCAYRHGVVADVYVEPFGSHNLTKDIAYQATTIEDAEKLKRKCTSLVMPDVPKIIRVPSATEENGYVFYGTDTLTNIASAREEEIIANIVQHIEDLGPEFKGKNLYITGGGSKQKGLVEFLRRNINMNVVMGSTIDKLLPETDPIYSSPLYTQLIGTLLLGAEYAKENPAKISPVNGKKSTSKPSIKDKLIDLFRDEQDLSGSKK